MCENTVKLCLVTVGQSPRPDMWDEIGQTLKFPLEVYHFGLLDSREFLEHLLVNSPEPDALVTRLRSGDTVRISSQKTHLALQDLIMELRKWEKPDGIIVLCTGIQEPETPCPIPVFYPGALIRKTALDKLTDPIGVILPDKRQWLFLDPELKKKRVVLFEINPPGDADVFREAAIYLEDRGARSVIFHCMGYPLSAIQHFSPHYSEKLAHPRILISQALNQRFG